MYRVSTAIDPRARYSCAVRDLGLKFVSKSGLEYWPTNSDMQAKMCARLVRSPDISCSMGMFRLSYVVICSSKSPEFVFLAC